MAPALLPLLDQFSIPKVDLCPYNVLLRRDFIEDVKNTTHSFSSWDSCMDNTGCKWVAIVGIILACLVALWILSSIFRCLFYGVGFVASLCCLCTACCCSSKRKSYRDTQSSYNPGAMPPPPQQTNYYVNNTYQPQPNPGPKITPAWETYSKDGTSSISTVPPSAPQQSAQPGGFFSGLVSNNPRYQPLDENTAYGGGTTTYKGNQGSAIEMTPYPLGENASYYNDQHGDMGNTSHYYNNSSHQDNPFKDSSAETPYGSQQPPPYK